MSGEPWTDALEGELTFPRISARYNYWQENPPASILLWALAVGLGVWRPSRRAGADARSTLRSLFPTGRI
ncbi:hypothetical protein [Rhodoblastus sp.]|uniref:hypothetical protein n=1 Tax=Rhodoblastus sp. TaxID=1962975 RepID=UPI0026350113|nr:hypothetical protein [Rhodoblastus sp.]